jgi:hypothetical protein
VRIRGTPCNFPAFCDGFLDMEERGFTRMFEHDPWGSFAGPKGAGLRAARHALSFLAAG